MTQEERDLLLKDICARLPYGILCKVQGCDEPKKLIRIEVDEVDGVLLDFGDNEEGLPIQVYLSEVKPYLRSMSNMTAKQKSRYKFLCDEQRLYGGYGTRLINWFIENHFDYRGLIPEGLALEALKDMYN